MKRIEQLVLIFAGTALLSGCGSTSAPAESYLQKKAQNAEVDGARRYSRGDFVGAKLSFSEAGKSFQAIDITDAAERNQLNAARAELALGQAAAALQRVSGLTEPASTVPALSIRAQAHLALGANASAQAVVGEGLSACPENCAEFASLRLLQSRIDLINNRPAEALAHVTAALKALQGKDESRELANAWRLLAAVRLALDDTTAAAVAAQSALELDRQLGLPEKIARDWLLLGDIALKANSPDATAAYQRALAVAKAAGLDDVARLAEAAIKGKQK